MGPRLRSAVGASFLVRSVMSFAAAALAGSVDLHSPRYALFLALAAALGFLLARPFGKHLDVRRTRITAMGLALTGAATLLVRQFG
ncbi:hypothetical protein [Actinophytocola sp.]|uniref:hypothetical protein n=1 Tax=Actinophytocola sp. TaxID=1872138 RepID=UPI002ED3B8CB